MCELNISADIYAHQETADARRFLQTLDPDLVHGVLLPEDGSLAQENVPNERATDCVYYDKQGDVIDASQLTVTALGAKCEFVVTNGGYLISRTMPGDALIKETNCEGVVTLCLARIFSVMFDAFKQPRLSYHCFLDDSQFEKTICKEERKTTGLQNFVCNAFLCLFDRHDTLLQNYKCVAKKLKRRAARQHLYQVGAWSRKLGVTIAYQRLDFMDTCDFLEFYHVPEKWMWMSCLGNYVCKTFVQPLLQHCVRTPKATTLFATAGNSTCMSLSFCETMQPCTMCDGFFGKCSMIVNMDNGVHVATDTKCANTLYLMFSLCQTLISFRRSQKPKHKQYELLHTFLAVARVRLHTDILNFF